MGDLMKQLKKQLIKAIKKANKIYVMGHQSIDLDAFGACIAIVSLAKKYGKCAKIIINEKEHESAVGQAIAMMEDKIKLIDSSKIKQTEENDLLIVVDTNKKHLMQDQSLLKKISTVIVIDHHITGKGSIKADISYINPTISSTCEILTDILLDKGVAISQNEATIILSGIVLDTNGYAINTSAQTHYLSAWLIEKKANVRKVQQLFKQDILDYKERQKLILDIEMKDKHTAITMGSQNKYYRREYLAKAADTLLLFKDIETSYVIGRLNKDEIGISARSLTNGNVNKVLSKMSGGGSPKEAATVIKEESLEKVKKQLLKNL